MHQDTITLVRVIEWRDQWANKLAVIDDCLKHAGHYEKLRLLNMRRTVARRVKRAQQAVSILMH